MSIGTWVGGCLRSVKQHVSLSHRSRDWPVLAIFALAHYHNFSNSDLFSRIARRLFPTLKVRTDRLDHIAVCINPSDPTHFPIFDEVVVENVYDLSLVPFVPDVVVDCGGHIGFFTARAAGRYRNAKIITYEPMPKNAEMIRKTVANNGLNVEVRQAAVSDRDYETKFYERVSYGGSLSGEVAGIVDTYEVRVIDLIAAIKLLGLHNLLLKMDIEGEEENLIPKLIPHLPPQCGVFFETHSYDKGWDLIVGAFHEAGFKTRLIRSRESFRDGFAIRNN